MVILTVLDQHPELASGSSGIVREQPGGLVEELGAEVIDGIGELNLIIPPTLDGSGRHPGDLPRVSV